MSDLSEIFSHLSTEEKPTNKTGLIFDERMKEHSCPWDANHIERPERMSCALERCRNYNLLDRCLILPPKSAIEDQVLLVHSAEYVESVKRTKDFSDEEFETFSSSYDAVYFNPQTYDSALLAAGCSIELVSSVLSGRTKNGLAIVRPPGHHATAGEACGFCVFNNVAIAARWALQEHKLNRILIVDWDVHHGNGTQELFYDDPRVLYFSIHRYEHGSFWPSLRESEFDYVGSRQGKGFNINVPLNKTKLGNTEYLAIFNNILLPLAYEYNPELILVSAGYDAALGCPEGEMQVTPQAYAHFINLLSGTAHGRLCLILEGGYCLPSLAESVALSLKALLGDPCPKLFPTEIIDDSVTETILNIITVLRPFWKSLCIQKEYSPSEKHDKSKSHVVKVKYLGNIPESKPQKYPTRDYYPIQEQSVRLAFESQLENLIGKTDLTIPQHKTCLVYDSRMNQHINKKEKDHPECYQRLDSIHSMLQAKGLLSNCLCVVSRKATEEELALVHSWSYINEMKSTITMKSRELTKFEDNFDSVFICPATYECATIATGCVLQTVDAVLTRKCANGFALVRPPGHHAEVGEACGFCIFNHVAIAAKYAMKKYFVQKILILDWDVHHGNGIQDVFYKDSHVLYISLHRYDNGRFFPTEGGGSVDMCGEGLGLGYNINIPWNDAVGTADYVAAFFHIVLPVAYEFSPDLVIVSAGFDAAQNDPLGECTVSPLFYGHMTKLLSGLADGKIVLALEGGYDLVSTSEAVTSCVSSLLGDPCEPIDSGSQPSAIGQDTIRRVVETHKKYWKCLQFGVDIPVSSEERTSENIVDNSKTSMPVTIPNREESNIIPEHPPADFTQVNIQATFYPDFNSLPQLYCVTPLEFCPHLELLQSIPPEGLNPDAVCHACGDPRENWVCLHCYQVYCGRFINEHMLQHGENLQHFLTLSYQDLSVWCYGCDAYVHNPVLMPVKQHVHVKKFGIAIG